MTETKQINRHRDITLTKQDSVYSGQQKHNAQSDGDQKPPVIKLGHPFQPPTVFIHLNVHVYHSIGLYRET